MSRGRIAAGALALLLLVAPRPAASAEPKRTVKEAAKTGGHTAREGARTFLDSTKALFTGGPSAAKEAWKAGAAKTKREAKSGAAATKHAAQQ